MTKIGWTDLRSCARGLVLVSGFLLLSSTVATPSVAAAPGNKPKLCPGLDDGNSCTADTCTSTGAQHNPVAAGTSCSDGISWNGFESCDGAGTCMPGTPPEPVSCSGDELRLVEIDADFREIHLGREAKESGKRTRLDPKITLEFNHPIDVSLLSARVVGHVSGSWDAPADCVDRHGEPRELSAVHFVPLAGETLGASWNIQTEDGSGQTYPGDFNLFVFEDVTEVNNVQGPIAAGGSATLQSFSVNNVAQLPHGVVAGRATLQSGALFGSLTLAERATLPTNVSLVNGAQLNTEPVDFEAAETALLSLSEALAGYTSTGTVSAGDAGALLLSGSSPGLNVFSVTAEQLEAASTVTVAVPAEAVVVVNVAGSELALSAMAVVLDGAVNENVLWNLFGVYDVSLSSLSFSGSMLAPNAAVSFASGNFQGTLVARSFVGSGHFEYFPFNAWDTVRFTSSVELELGDRLLRGCEYSLVVDATPVTSSGCHLPAQERVAFFTVANGQTAFDRETERASYDDALETPAFFRVKPGINTEVPRAIARYAETFGLREGIDTLEPLMSATVRNSQDTADQAYYEQRYRGVPLDGFGYVLETVEGELRGGTGRLLPNVAYDIAPSIDDLQAEQAALASLGVVDPPWLTHPGEFDEPRAELRFVGGGAGAPHTLAWRVDLDGLDQADFVDVSAADGQVLFVQPTVNPQDCGALDLTKATVEEQLQSVVQTPDGIEDDVLVERWRQDDDLHVALTAGYPYLLVTDRIVADGSYYDVCDAEQDLVWDPPLDTCASAHWSAQRTLDMFRGFDFQGSPWIGIAGDGNGQLLVTIREDSDPDFLKIGSHAEYPLNTDAWVHVHLKPQHARLSIAGHEVGHGALVSRRLRSGFYPMQAQNESGALSESFADVAAFTAQYQYLQSEDWYCINPECRRNAKTPKLSGTPSGTWAVADFYQGQHWKTLSPPSCTQNCCDMNCVVHDNSLVPSHWFYLLATGADDYITEMGCSAPVTPLSPDLGESTLMATNVMFTAVGSLLDSSADFAAARIATVAAADALFNADPRAKRSVEQAWNAVGVGAEAAPGHVAV